MSLLTGATFLEGLLATHWELLALVEFGDFAAADGKVHAFWAVVFGDREGFAVFFDNSGADSLSFRFCEGGFFCEADVARLVVHFRGTGVLGLSGDVRL